MSSGVRIARWESRSGKHYVELYRDSPPAGTMPTYTYRAPGQGGWDRFASDEEAIHDLAMKVADGLFQPDANKTPMRRVL